jgi:hypothetical protein
MKHVKLFENFLNEKNMNARELAKHVWDNWKKITGLNPSARNEEGHFPQEVEDLMDKHGVDYQDFSDAWTEIGDLNESQLDESSKLNESVYPKGKGGAIENSLRSEEVGRLNLKHKGEIIGTLLVWMRPYYGFGNEGYDESRWEYGASYTSYPMWGGGRFSDGSTGSGVWSSDKAIPKAEALKACKEFMKNVKLG